jgi:hypothetical protein
MSHLTRRTLHRRHLTRSADQDTTGRHQLQMRALATTLLCSLGLMSYFAAAAQAAPQPRDNAGTILTSKAITQASTARQSTANTKAPCGFNLIGAYAYYNHCGPTWVCIRVLTRGDDYDKMVPPWRNTLLGPHDWVEWAYYVRPNCFA